MTLRTRLATMARMAWASPCTLLGLLFGVVVLAFGGTARRVGPALEFALTRQPYAALPNPFRWPFSAITLGHVIVGVSADELERLRAHEQAHVRQYERWGPLFLLAYPACSLFAILQGKPAHAHNHFELQACREAAHSTKGAR